jgi:hypothetical protein
MRTMRRAKPPRAPILVQGLRAALASGRRGLRMLLRRLKRQPGHLVRVLGRLKTRSKARRQDKTETETP